MNISALTDFFEIRKVFFESVFRRSIQKPCVKQEPAVDRYLVPASQAVTRMWKAPLCNGDACSAVRILGITLPLCARCLSLSAGLMLAWVLQLPYSPIWLVLIAPAIVDAAIHYLNIDESSNTRRFLTGIPGGIGLWLSAMGIVSLCKGVEACLLLSS